MCGIHPPLGQPAQTPVLHDPRETRLRNVRQLTFGGENAEAYFSFDGKKLIFQSTRPPFTADQMFTMNIDGTDVRLVSTGKGRCTCGFWSPDGKKILYSSTDWYSAEPPPPPDRSQGYVWGLFPYRLYLANADGSERVALTDDDAYNAEGSFHPRGDRVLFTTTRWGNIDLAELNLRTKRIRRLTTEIGYNGGPFYSWDGRYIVYRAYHPKTEEEIKEFQDLLRKRLVRPSKLELWVMTADGRRKRRVSQLGQANFAPFMKPGNRQIIFTSNHHDPRGREFDLFLINLDGTGVERITYTGDFDGFPMFSRDGKMLVWASNRTAKTRGETNIYIADWVDVP